MNNLLHFFPTGTLFFQTMISQCEQCSTALAEFTPELNGSPSRKVKLTFLAYKGKKFTSLFVKFDSLFHGSEREKVALSICLDLRRN